MRAKPPLAAAFWGCVCALSGTSPPVSERRLSGCRVEERKPRPSYLSFSNESWEDSNTTFFLPSF